LTHCVELFSTTNTCNNASAIKKLEHIFGSHTKGFGAVMTGIHCIGHVLNYVVNLYLHGNDTADIKSRMHESTPQWYPNLLHPSHIWGALTKL